jgi:outer membrane protein TolC
MIDLSRAALGAARALLLACGGCVSPDSTENRTAASDAAAGRLGFPVSLADRTDEAPPTAAPVTSDDAVRLALASNPALRQRLADVDAARATLAQTSTPPNPVVELMVAPPVGGAGGTAVFAAVTQQIGWLLRRPAALDGDEARLRAATLSAADAAVALVAEVRLAWIDVCAAEAREAASRRRVAAAERAASATRALAETGAASDADLATDESLASAARRDAARATRDLAAARAAFAAAVGRADLATGWRTDGAWPELPAALDACDADPDLRLDVLASEALVVAADADCARAGASRLGDLALGLAYDRQSLDSAEEATLGPSLTVEVPIFDRGDARAAGAVARRSQAIWACREVRTRAAVETREAAEAYRALTSAWRDGSERRVEFVRAAHAAREAERAAGLASARDVAALEMELAEAQRDAIEDRREASAAMVRWMRSRGPAAAPRLAGGAT